MHLFWKEILESKLEKFLDKPNILDALNANGTGQLYFDR